MRRLSATISRLVSFALLQVDEDPSCGASSWRRRSTPPRRAPSSTRRWRGGRPGCSPGDFATLLPLLRGSAYVELRKQATSRHRRVCGGAGETRGPHARSCRGRHRRRQVAQAMEEGGTGARTCWATHPSTSRDRSARWPGLAAAPGRPPRSRWPTTRMAPQRWAPGCWYLPILNYSNGDLDHVYDMLQHPQGLLGFVGRRRPHRPRSATGSMPTFMLTHWTRDRSQGRDVAARVHREEADPRHGQAVRPVGPGHGRARHAGRLQPHRLRRARRWSRRSWPHDLPAGGRRLLQRATGYAATIKNGVVTFENGEPTGELHGVACCTARARHPAPRQATSPPGRPQLVWKRR